MSSKFKDGKDSFWKKVHLAINKVFEILKEIGKALHLLWENTSRLAIFLFSLMVKSAASPSSACLVAIAFFGIVVVITTAQWYQIGFWLGGMIGVQGFWGIGSGMMGVLLGVGLNIYQLAPQLWKVRKDIAKSYQALGIDPDMEVDANNLQSRVQNWLSYDHGTLKATRLIAYVIETALVLTFLFLGAKLSFFGQLQAIISLLLPEQCLALVSSTIGLLGTVSEKVAETEDNSTF